MLSPIHSTFGFLIWLEDSTNYATQKIITESIVKSKPILKAEVMKQDF